MNLSALKFSVPGLATLRERFPPDSLRYRAVVLSRAVLAGGGGYALAAASAAFFAQIMVVLGMVRNEATSGATMLAFIVQCIAVLWVLGCRSNRRAWLGILIPTAVISALVWALATLGGLAI